MIARSQLLNPETHSSTFECLLCGGIAWEPQVTMCCQRVFCGGCMDRWLLAAVTCPSQSCNSVVVDPDGSTGGCAEDHVKKLSPTGPLSVLYRIYGGLRLRCKNQCGWAGPITSYSEHMATCNDLYRAKTDMNPATAPKPAPAPAAVRPTPLPVPTPAAREAPQPAREPVPVALPAAERVEIGSPDAKAAVLPGSVLEVVLEHNPTESGQLTLRLGDQVRVQQVAAHGWVYGELVANNKSSRGGWFPSFCLSANQPPKPQQSPPPSSPPDGSTEVMQKYEATDPVQLSVAQGELVKVRQRDSSGWTFVVRVNSQPGVPREGWVPNWLLKGEK